MPNQEQVAKLRLNQELNLQPRLAGWSAALEIGISRERLSHEFEEKGADGFTDGLGHLLHSAPLE